MSERSSTKSQRGYNFDEQVNVWFVQSDLDEMDAARGGMTRQDYIRMLIRQAASMKAILESPLVNRVVKLSA